LPWEFGDYAIRYRVRYWLADYGRSEQIHARVVSGLWYALRRHAIEIPFPVRTLVLKQESQVEASEALREIAAELRSVDFLRELSDDEVRILAGAVRVRQLRERPILLPLSVAPVGGLRWRLFAYRRNAKICRTCRVVLVLHCKLPSRSG